MYLRPDFRQILGNGDDSFERILSLRGHLVKQMDGRRTLRLELGGRGYYLKAHNGVGWQEIFKNLVSLKRPVLGARDEWRAIQRLDRIGVPTTPLVGYGQRGINPARRRSFVITEEIPGIVKLEDLCAPWAERPPRAADEVRFKRALLKEVARVARRLHGNGMNHRDFYLCHLCLQYPTAGGDFERQPDLRLYLLDLHRAQIRRRTPWRWLVKDLGSLYFSAMEIGLTQRDRLRFIAHYRQQPLRMILANEGKFWQAVRRRAFTLYRSFHHREPPIGH